MRFRVPASVAWLTGDIVEDPNVYLMRVPDGRSLVLRGISAAIWLAAASGEDVVPTIAASTGETEETVAADTLAFLDQLTHLGLLAVRSEENA